MQRLSSTRDVTSTPLPRLTSFRGVSTRNVCRSVDTHAPSVRLLGLLPMTFFAVPAAEAALLQTSDTPHIFMVAAVTLACATVIGAYIIKKSKEELEEDQLTERAWDLHRAVVQDGASGDGELEFATASASVASTQFAKPDVMAAVATPTISVKTAVAIPNAAPTRSAPANTPVSVKAPSSPEPSNNGTTAVSDATAFRATASIPPAPASQAPINMDEMKKQQAEARAWIARWQQRQAEAVTRSAAAESTMAAATQSARQAVAASESVSAPAGRAPHALDIPSAGNARLLTGQRLAEPSDEGSNMFAQWWRALLAFFQGLWENIVALFRGGPQAA